MNQRTDTRSNFNTNVSKKSNRILAIDPGTKIMGYADFEANRLVDYGLRLFKPVRRIEDLLSSIEEVIHRLITEKNPQIIIVEKNRFSQITNNVRLTMAIVRIKSIAKTHKIKVIEYAPKTIRAIVTKNGYSTKSDTAKIIVSKYPEIGLLIKNQSHSSLNIFYNITDAIACGQTFIDVNSSNK